MIEASQCKGVGRIKSLQVWRSATGAPIRMQNLEIKYKKPKGRGPSKVWRFPGARTASVSRAKNLCACRGLIFMSEFNGNQTAQQLRTGGRSKVLRESGARTGLGLMCRFFSRSGDFGPPIANSKSSNTGISFTINASADTAVIRHRQAAHLFSADSSVVCAGGGPTEFRGCFLRTANATHFCRDFGNLFWGEGESNLWDLAVGHRRLVSYFPAQILRNIFLQSGDRIFLRFHRATSSAREFAAKFRVGGSHWLLRN
jgi:hypothetical protein